jgi:hypothetical protein
MGGYMVGSVLVQALCTFFLYGLLYLSIHTLVFAKCGTSKAVQRERIHIALFTGVVLTALNVVIFAAYVEGANRFFRSLFLTALPMVPAILLAIIFLLIPSEKKDAGKFTRGGTVLRYALGCGGLILCILLYAVFSRQGFPVIVLIDPVSFIVVLIGFGLGELLWLIPRQKRPKEHRKIYRPGFISTIIFFYSMYTAVSLFLLVNGSLGSLRDISDWTGVLLRSILYYAVLYIVLRGVRVRRLCKTGLLKTWKESAWQRVIVPVSAIFLFAVPYIFFAWFLR